MKTYIIKQSRTVMMSRPTCVTTYLFSIYLAISMIMIMLRFSQIALTWSKQNWKFVKSKGLC